MNHACRCLLLLIFLAGQSNSAMSQDDPFSDLKSDERVVLFATDAMLSADRSQWIVPLHVWVHELERASIRRMGIAAALRTSYGLSATPKTQANFDRRVRLIVADNERGKRIVVDIAGKKFALPDTEPNGHSLGAVKLDAKLVEKHRNGETLTYSANLKSADKRNFAGTINLVPPRGISVISDFDDTVKITHATNRGKMLDQSLFQNFQPVPGMAQVYAAWAKQGVTYHFVSSSPWHFYELIDAFLNANGFPPRSVSLKHFRFKDTSLLNLFKKGTETKPAQIVPIIRAFPQRRFVLIGDSGEEDPEVYAGIYQQFPEKIERIFIRNISGAKRTDQRFTAVFKNVPEEKWSLFDDPQELSLPGQ